MKPALPRWADLALIPALNLLLAFLVAGLVVLFIGENPVKAMRLLIQGSLGSSYAIGFTLYYATTFVFTGLSVAIAFHAGLFNIGGEGQAALGGIGVTLVCLALPWPHWALALPFAILGAGLFGAAWAFVPGYLQAKRGSHIVITTIMFNFIAAALVVYLLVNVMKVPGSMAPETANFPEGDAAAVHARDARRCRHRHVAHADEPDLDPRGGRGVPDLGADLAHPARLRDARLRAFGAGGGLCRHRPGADHRRSPC